MPDAPAPASVRPAEWKDVDAILDLLTEYDLPRSSFEPWYLQDPSYQPRQSWLVEQAGQLVAHLRVLDRTILIHGEGARVAGISNVITARAARGRGYASMLLERILDVLPHQGYAYSLLGTAIPALYARYGWVPLAQEVVRARLTGNSDWPGRIGRFESDDLPDVMRLYQIANAQRTGPTVRSAAHWRAQLAWLPEDRTGFLVARTVEGELIGYVRSRSTPGQPTDVLELGLSPARLDVGRALLGRIAALFGPELAAHLPPSLLDVFRPDERVVRADQGLMARALDLELLVRSLRNRWEHGLRSSELAGAHLRLRTSAGTVDIRVGDGTPPVLTLDEAQFTHLLFHGVGSAAAALGIDSASEVLQALFPPQDFVMWPADDF